MPERAIFYYDLGSPYAYLAAERISGLFTEAELEQPEWQPILLGGLFQRLRARVLVRDRDARPRTSPRSSGGRSPTGCRRSSGPTPAPANSLNAMRVATFAKQTGRAVSFSLAAFRQAFAAGAT